MDCFGVVVVRGFLPTLGFPRKSCVSLFCSYYSGLNFHKINRQEDAFHMISMPSGILSVNEVTHPSLREKGVLWSDNPERRGSGDSTTIPYIQRVAIANEPPGTFQDNIFGS